MLALRISFNYNLSHSKKMLQVNNGRVDIRGIVEIFDVEWPLQNLAFTVTTSSPEPLDGSRTGSNDLFRKPCAPCLTVLSPKCFEMSAT